MGVWKPVCFYCKMDQGEISRAIHWLKFFAAAMGATEGFHSGNLAAGNAFFALRAFEAAEIINQANCIGQQREGKKQAIAGPVLEPKEQIA